MAGARQPERDLECAALFGGLFGGNEDDQDGGVLAFLVGALRDAERAAELVAETAGEERGRHAAAAPFAE